MRNFFRNNGLSIAVLSLFFLSWAGQLLTGRRVYNEQLSSHGEAPISFTGYLSSAHFLEATAENWESEFLQMGMYVVLTTMLFQKGSSESKALGKPEEVDRDPRLSRDKVDAPWPVRKGGMWLRIYENSLSIAFALLFITSWVLHLIGSRIVHNKDAVEHGQATNTLWEYLGSAQFWFESFQNWQSEFLSIAAMVILSIFLRQRGSPESKPVDAPHGETGE